MQFPFRSTAQAAAGLAVAIAALPAQADITIGVTMPLSGPAASLGQPARTGLSLWPESIDGEKLHVIVLDDAGDPATATQNARRFVDEKADLLVGSVITPTTLAVAQVAAEAQVPQLSPAPVELPPGKDTWTFRLAMYQAFYVQALVEHMTRAGVKTVAFLGLSDALGEQHLQALTRQAAAVGLKVVAVERFARGDASVAVQALKVVSAQPDAVLVAASGGGASLPQKALLERGYKGRIYHGSASVSADFLRLSGKEAEGALMVSGPEQVPEQLPATHPARQVGLDFVQRYERQYGPGSRTQFAAHLFDIGQLLGKAVPLALKQAKPGTPAFRQALRDAFETVGEVPTSKGPLRYSATDHWGRGPSARVMLTVKNGAWTYVP